jgi:DNA-binding response OmpR family regulator
MDIMLKDNISGSEAALKLHSDNCASKVIFVTAYAEEEMLDYAVRSKAYGYILKPYREQEIFATIRLALSHDKPDAKRENNIVQLKNNYAFHLDTQKLYHHDKEVPLAKMKRKLLEILAKNRGHSVSNEQICLHVWGSIQNYSTLRSLVYRIRNEIGEDMIISINGLGYMLS